MKVPTLNRAMALDSLEKQAEPDSLDLQSRRLIGQESGFVGCS
jgi:hypothetical protein